MGANFTLAMFRRLSEDVVLNALLSRYDGRAAVFTMVPVPGDAAFPYLVTEGESAAQSFTTDALAGLVQARDIYVFDEALGSAARIELIATRLYALFTWTSTAVPGFEKWYAKTTPAVVSTDQGLAKTVDVNVRRVRVYLFNSQVEAGTIGFVNYETPSQDPDGYITNFSTSRAFIPGSLMVWVNSVAQIPGTDFTEDTDRRGYTFTSGAPLAGAVIFHQYRY